MQEELENTIKQVNKEDFLIEAYDFILQKEVNIKAAIGNIVDIFKEYAETNDSEKIIDLHRDVCNLFLETYRLDEVVSQLFTLDKFEKDGKIVRLFTGFEELLEYDKEAQEYWEDDEK